MIHVADTLGKIKMFEVLLSKSPFLTPKLAYTTQLPTITHSQLFSDDLLVVNILGIGVSESNLLIYYSAHDTSFRQYSDILVIPVCDFNSYYNSSG